MDEVHTGIEGRRPARANPSTARDMGRAGRHLGGSRRCRAILFAAIARQFPEPVRGTDDDIDLSLWKVFRPLRDSGARHTDSVG